MDHRTRSARTLHSLSRGSGHSINIRARTAEPLQSRRYTKKNVRGKTAAGPRLSPSECVVEPIGSAKYFDASDRGLSHISSELLREASHLETINIRNNQLSAFPKLSYCINLWNLDISNNRLLNLDGLERFSILGQLDLSGNKLTWPELFKLRHIQILSLVLFDNPLENDLNYRAAVIDIFPQLWSLDGVLITCEERQQVKSYFDSHEDNPRLRRKRPRTSFVSSSIRNVRLTGLHGPKANSIIKHFPASGFHNDDVDRKRLVHLTEHVYDELHDRLSYERVKGQLRYLPPVSLPSPQSILNLRPDQRNMMYFLLVSSLRFAIPGDLLRAALEITKIPKLDQHDPATLFFWPAWCRSKLVCILASAAELPQATLDNAASLYPQLRLCLRNMSAFMLRRTHPQGASRNINKFTRPIDNNGYIPPHGNDPYVAQTGKRGAQRVVPPQARPVSITHEPNFGNLLAVELAQLLCLIPEFPSCIGRSGDHGLIEILEEATEDPSLYPTLMAIITAATNERATMQVGNDASKQQNENMTVQPWAAAYREVSVYLLERIRKNSAANGISIAEGVSSVFGGSEEMNWRQEKIDRPGTASVLPRLQRPERPRTAPTHKILSISVGDVIHLDGGETARVIGLPELGVATIQLNPYTSPFGGTERAAPTYAKVVKSAIRIDPRGRLTMNSSEVFGDSYSESSHNHSAQEWVEFDDLSSDTPRRKHSARIKSAPRIRESEGLHDIVKIDHDSTMNTPNQHSQVMSIDLNNTAIEHPSAGVGQKSTPTEESKLEQRQSSSALDSEFGDDNIDILDDEGTLTMRVQVQVTSSTTTRVEIGTNSRGMKMEPSKTISQVSPNLDVPRSPPSARPLSHSLSPVEHRHVSPVSPVRSLRSSNAKKNSFAASGIDQNQGAAKLLQNLSIFEPKKPTERIIKRPQKLGVTEWQPPQNRTLPSSLDLAVTGLSAT